ncbi:MAG: anhydro-N-acetylmuramic acid kinase [Pseudomonadales bacterium]
MDKPYFIGLMSGTSLDAIDAALVDFSSGQPRLVAAATSQIPQQLRQDLLALCSRGENEVLRMGCADHQVGRLFAEAVNNLLAETGIKASQVSAIGSHGQTIRHEPCLATPFTLQIGDPNVIAQQTGITTVADFRRRDMAAGGQGAPLAPGFHAAQFHSLATDRAILNIGGMANLTFLPASKPKEASGFDTGPGNVLIDHWCQLHTQQPFDSNGSWARSGTVDQELLKNMLTTSYFQEAPPKSTGRELFNPHWLSTQLQGYTASLKAKDIAATLTELTTITISQALQQHFSDCREIYVCGGGAHNGFLLERIAALNPGCSISTTQALDVPPDWVEAIAFAWLAKQTLARSSGNLPAVTGANEPCILGGVYYA